MSLLCLFLVLVSPSSVVVAEEIDGVEIPAFGEIKSETMQAYLKKAKEGLFWVCFMSATWKEDVTAKTPVFEALAKSEKWSKYPFTYLNMDMPDQYEDSGCKKDKITLIFQTSGLDDEEAPFFRLNVESIDEITEDKIGTFMQEVLDGKIEAVDPDEPPEIFATDFGDDEDEEGEM